MSTGVNIAFVVVAVVLIVTGFVLTWRERRTTSRRR
jgi:hypothetical protein